MTYIEFERKILKMVYETGATTLQAPELAFAFATPVETIEHFLTKATQFGVLELELNIEGEIEYFVPGFRKEGDENREENLVTVQSAPDQSGADGSLNSSVHHSISTPVDKGQDGGIRSNAIIVSRYESTPSFEPQSKALTVVSSHAMVERTQLVESEEGGFSNTSRSMFNRKIKIYGNPNPQLIRDQVQRLFHTFGYRVLSESPDSIRFERGSLAFLVALIPLFILILPMLVYVIMSIMGRSTIQKEPILLDVKFRQKQALESYWEIDLTFLGLHGVILGPADQQVLNREIDTLRDELMIIFEGS